MKAPNPREPQIEPMKTNAASEIYRWTKRLRGKGSAPVGWSRIDDTRPSDVFIVGYPKSGNTWCQHLIAGLVFGINPRIAHDSLIQDLIPDVHSRLHFRRYEPMTIFKSHDLPRPEHNRVIYVVRDGRDVMVSYLHHLAALMGSVDARRVISTGEGLFPCKWKDHVVAWHRSRSQSARIDIKYESLLQDPVRELTRVARFLEITRTRDWIRSVAEEASFPKMREKEREQGWENLKWPREKDFVRRGVSGSYRDELTPDLLHLFMKDAAEAMAIYEEMD